MIKNTEKALILLKVILHLHHLIIKVFTFLNKIRINNLDSIAQLVEHNTFNVGVLGSSPSRVTNYNLGEVPEW